MCACVCGAAVARCESAGLGCGADLSGLRQGACSAYSSVRCSQLCALCPPPLHKQAPASEVDVIVNADPKFRQASRRRPLLPPLPFLLPFPPPPPPTARSACADASAAPAAMPRGAGARMVLPNRTQLRLLWRSPFLTPCPPPPPPTTTSPPPPPPPPPDSLHLQRNIELKQFRGIPIADLELVMPEKKVFVPPKVFVEMAVTLIGGLVAMMAGGGREGVAICSVEACRTAVHRGAGG